MNRWVHLAFPIFGLVMFFLAGYLYARWVLEDCQEAGFHYPIFTGHKIECTAREINDGMV